MEMFELVDKMARGLIPVPEPPKKPRPKTPPKPSGPAAPVRDTFDDLLEILRACPAENLPATPEAAPAQDPPLDNSSFVICNLSLMGTPRAHSWDDAWLEVVNAAESRIGRRICGARTEARRLQGLPPLPGARRRPRRAGPRGAPRGPRALGGPLTVRYPASAPAPLSSPRA